ncbi:putative siderophore transport system permease protein YfhA [compost metagenome]
MGIWRGNLLFILTLSAVCGMLFSLASGAVKINPLDIWRVLISQDPSPIRDIVWNIRLPRTLVAALVGVNLSISGVLLQGVMRNPMADPHIIGVSSGAGLIGLAVLIIFPAHAYLLTPAAFLGAIGAALLIYALSWKRGASPIRVILAGVAVSALLNSGISGLLTFYSDRVEGALIFLVGGLSARSWPHVDLMLPYTLGGLLLTMIGSQRMNILLMGEEVAKSLGLRVEFSRLYFTAVATLLAASAVSVAGLLGFVGLIVPHAARMLVGNDFRILIPASALLGITVLTISDTLARIVFAPIELPVGILMGVIGAPFFIYLLRKKS